MTKVLDQWIGATSTASDVVTPRLIQALRAALFVDPMKPVNGEPAPVSVHWCLGPSLVKLDELAADGLPAHGGLLPPIPLPRRMWAGGKLEYHDVLHVGDVVERSSEITQIVEKQGKSGPLCFVTIESLFSTGRGLAVREEQQMVYRGAATPSEREEANMLPAGAMPAQHRRVLIADAPALFRYSAVTANDHRIHYDWPYVTGVEGYPGLIVHGPLQASLLVEYAAELLGRSPRSVIFRASRPLFAGPFSLNANATGAELKLWVADSLDRPTITADVN